MALVNFITAPFPSGRETSSAMSAVLLPVPLLLFDLLLSWVQERRGPGTFSFPSVRPSSARSLVDPEMPTDGVDLQMRSAEVKFTSRCLMPPSLSPILLWQGRRRPCLLSNRIRGISLLCYCTRVGISFQDSEP